MIAILTFTLLIMGFVTGAPNLMLPFIIAYLEVRREKNIRFDN